MLPLAFVLSLCPSLVVPASVEEAATPPAPKVAVLEAKLLERRAADRDDPLPVEALAEACRDAQDIDGEAAYLLCAADLIDKLEVDDARAKESKLRAYAARIEELGARSEGIRQSQDALVKDLAWAMELYSKNKKPRNTLEMAARLMLLRPKSSQAKLIVERTLAAMTGDERLLAEQILLRGELTRPKAFLDQWRTEHGEWSKADKLETSGYVLRSDIGYRELHLAARALEQLAVYYRRFYAPPSTSLQDGKTMVYLCKSEATFAQVLGQPLEQLTNVKGMLRTTYHPDGPKEFQLYGWDYREDATVFDELFDTLAHEASHQYMALACPVVAPLWLNEGMACYFEGAKLSRDGTVSVGMPASSRLRHLMYLWGDRQVLLKSTLTADPQRFLTPDEYALAWSLIYFLRHYETDEGDHPFRDALVRLIAAPGQQGGSWETPLMPLLHAARWSSTKFVDEWSSFIQALAQRAANPREAVAWHLAAAERFQSKGAHEVAREHLELALQYDDGGHQAAVALAEHAALRAKTSKEAAPKQAAAKDEALALVHRAYRAALVADDEADTQALSKTAALVDPAGFDKVAKGEAKYLAGIRAEQARMIAAGRPRTAVALARRWLDRVLDEDHSGELALELRRKGVLELRLPLSLGARDAMDGVSADGGWKATAGGYECAIPRDPQGVAYFRALRFDSSVGARFELAFELEVLDEGACFLAWVQPQGTPEWKGFCLRSTLSGPDKPRFESVDFIDMDHGTTALLDRGEDASGRPSLTLRKEGRGAIDLKAGKPVKIQLAHSGDGVLRLEVDGKLKLERPIDAKVRSWRLGLGFHGGDGRVTTVVGHELDRL